MSKASNKIYKKADSIFRLSNKDSSHDDLLAKIQRVKEALSGEGYREQIISKACNDLLSTGEEDRLFSLKAHVVEELKRISDDLLPRYLFYRYRYDVFPATFQVDDFPPCLQIEPSSICNYRCVFCYQTDSRLTLPKNGHMKMMDLDLFKRVVDQAEGRCEAITLASRGEPLIGKQINQMLDYLSGKFLALKVNTNAWYLDEEKAHTILQAGVNTLVFSADAAEEPLYSQLRVNGNLERVLNNIERFQKIRETQYPDANLITRVSGVQYHKDQDFGSMEHLWSGLVDQVAFVDYVPWETTYERDINEITQPCSDLFRRMFVWADGRVNPCDVDYLSTLSVGNTMDVSLSDLWTGDAYAQMREKHLNKQRGNISPCDRCSFV